MAGIAIHLRIRKSSVFRYVLNKVSFRLIKSKTIHKGVITMIITNIIPKGFQYKAPAISPFMMDKIDLVDPQDGQGMVVTCLNKQTPGSANC